MTRPAVLFGGPAPEHDVSILTGLQACRALLDAGVDVGAIYWAKSGAFFSVAPDLEARAFLDGPPPGATPLELATGAGGGFQEEARLGRRRPHEVSAVLNCCHGGPGEDGSLQAALDLAGVRYTGPSAAGAALGMDKLAFRAVAAAAGAPVLPGAALTADGPDPDFDGPYIVKPRFGGSSIGIETVDDLDTARALLRSSVHLRAGAVIEPFRADAVDLNIAVRTHPEVQLSAIERPLAKEDGRPYTYAEKYLSGGEGLSSAPRELPADVPGAIESAMRAAAERIVAPALVRGVVRLDFLWCGDEVFVNEINTIPGALAWYFWDHAGTPIARLLQDLLAEAESGPARAFSTEGADGTALRAAGSIASKLA